LLQDAFANPDAETVCRGSLKFLILEDESVHPFRIYKNIANFVARTNISDVDEVKAVRCVGIL
jgi:hypothetical protein